MRNGWPVAARLAPAVLAGMLLAACAAPKPKPPPNPLELLRGWQVYTYGAGDAPVGRTAVPEHPVDRDKPREVLPSIVRAFCRPVDDGEAAAVADEALRDFCKSSAARDPTARVVLSPGWEDAVPPYPHCFIRCVCEGYAPRLDDAVDQARESETGPCTNRLNCRLECPAD
jgi:hypothetical protein